MSTIETAVEILRSGGIVAFPTETVYGLGADATSASAVQRVFDAKGRPPTNPVIVHVADAAVAKRYTTAWPDVANLLCERFWPGPLTLVLPQSADIVDQVTAGRETVGLRVPDHPLTLELLRQFDRPMIGPSANRSSHVSPTTAEHVRDDLADSVDLIVDGGPCRLGIESTVLDLSTPRPRILRPGAVAGAQLEALIGPVDLFRGAVALGATALSPGQHAVHYSPSTPTYRYPHLHPEVVIEWSQTHPADSAIALELSSVTAMAICPNIELIHMPDSAAEYARQMYATLRTADRQAPSAIWIEMPPEKPEWLAVRDRLTRATRQAP